MVIRDVQVVNEGRVQALDVWFRQGRIERIGSGFSLPMREPELVATGLYLLPGVIDDQVHFREPGLTHKGDLTTESRAAVAGGITTFMEMPNTVPNTLTQELLEQKYNRAAQVSAANYSFFMGVSNDNYDEVMRTDPQTVCGLKIFMGSSTGNMLVDNPATLEQVFANAQLLIATHCEDEATVTANLHRYQNDPQIQPTAALHPLIRSAEACYLSSSFAVGLARRYDTRLHVLHISTARETELFDNTLPLAEKRITAEACIHHLWFTDEDYAAKGNFIKWNPAVKTSADRQGIWDALLADRIDIIATDHAPHTLAEKEQPYFSAPSGGPLVQHALVAMLEAVHQGKLTLEKLVEKMCHAPAVCFGIHERGFIREGYPADLVLVDLNRPTHVDRASLLYKCGWSPFEGTTFRSSVLKTWVNDSLAYDVQTGVDTTVRGQRVRFNRPALQ
jgi:dihydroorotase